MDRRIFLKLTIALVAVDLLAFGMNYNALAPRGEVYPETAGIKALKRIAGMDTIAVINNRWSLYKTPSAVLPPNAAMVYGLYDAGGYDSLFPKARKERIDRILGEDSSPVENGNMVFIKRYNPALRKKAGVVVSAEPLDDPSLHEEYSGEFHIYRVDGGPKGAVKDRRWTNPNRISTQNRTSGTAGIPGWKLSDGLYKYEPHSIRTGLFLMLMGISLICGLSAYERAGLRSRR